MVLVGATRGATTLLQASLVADLWGTTRYGALTGVFPAPITVAGAVIPWAAIALADLFGGSYPALFALLAVPVAAAVTATGRRPANSLTDVDTSSIVDR